MSSHPETGEDPALTLAQGSTPVDGVNGLSVENRPPQQLHHVSPQLHSIIQPRAVGGQQALKYTQKNKHTNNSEVVIPGAMLLVANQPWQGLQRQTGMGEAPECVSDSRKLF